MTPKKADQIIKTQKTYLFHNVETDEVFSGRAIKRDRYSITIITNWEKKEITGLFDRKDLTVVYLVAP